MSNFIYYEKLEDYEEQVRKAKLCDEKDKEIERLKQDNEYLNKVNIELSTEKNRLNNIINKCTEDILKELEENHHLSYGVALAIRQKLLDYKELKGEDKE